MDERKLLFFACECMMTDFNVLELHSNLGING